MYKKRHPKTLTQEEEILSILEKELSDIKKFSLDYYHKLDEIKRCKGRVNAKRYYERHAAVIQEKRKGANAGEVHAALLEEHGEICPICGGHPDTLLVDRDQETGEARALLCERCLKGLVMLSDDPVRIKSALDYIKKHQK